MSSEVQQKPNADAVGIRPRLQDVREIEKQSGTAAAERVIVQMLRDGETSHLAYMALARLLAKQKKYDDAYRAARKAKLLAPLEADCSILMGMIALRSQNTEAAATALADALRLDPASPKASMAAAMLKFQNGAYDEALTLCNKVIDLDPTIVQAHELSARILMKTDRKEEAILALKTLILRNPSDMKMLRVFIGVMREMGRGEEVLELLEADALAAPDDPDRQDRLARAAVSVGRPEMAVEYYEQLASAGSPRLIDKVRYAMLLIQTGELVKARVMVEQLGRQKVLKPVVAKLLGDIALKSDDPEAAIRKYREACRAARVPRLPAEIEDEAENAEELAESWRKHAQEQIETARRNRRGGETV